MVSAKTGFTETEEFELSPLADVLAGSVGPISDTLPAGIDIGNGVLADDVVLLISGTGKTKTVISGGEEFELTSIKLKSVGLAP